MMSSAVTAASSQLCVLFRLHSASVCDMSSKLLCWLSKQAQLITETDEHQQQHMLCEFSSVVFTRAALLQRNADCLQHKVIINRRVYNEAVTLTAWQY